MQQSMRAALVGTKFRGQAAIDTMLRMREGDAVRLEREPSNRYDANAIQVHFLGMFVGFIAKLANPRIAAAMDRGCDVQATVISGATMVRGRPGEPLLNVFWEE